MSFPVVELEQVEKYFVQKEIAWCVHFMSDHINNSVEVYYHHCEEASEKSNRNLLSLFSILPKKFKKDTSKECSIPPGTKKFTSSS